MKSLIENLYYGNVYAKDIVLPEKLFEAFLELTEDNHDDLMLMIYKRGVSTGIMLAAEAFIEGENLCD